MTFQNFYFMKVPVNLPDINNITISGRIGSGASTLAGHLKNALGWGFLNGGDLFRSFAKEKGLNIIDTNKRPDKIDLEYEEKIKKILNEQSRQIIQSHLAGFDAQNISGVYKILVICEDVNGEDKVDIRIDRLVNRDGKTVEDAKYEIFERERQNLEKWRRLYAKGNPDWIYWDPKYYNMVINTYSLNAEESCRMVLDAIGFGK